MKLLKELNESAARVFNLLTREEMDKLPTHRLLSYYKARRKEHQTAGQYSDDGGYDDEIMNTLTIAKDILDKREHLEK